MAATSTKAIRQALYSKLTGTPALTALLSSSSAVYHQVAPEDAEYPFLVFNKQAGTPTYAFGVTAFDSQVWQIKVIDRNSTSNAAEDIARQIDATLSNQTLTLSSGSFMGAYRTSDVDYLELEDGQQIRHHGALFRIVAQ